MGAQSPYNVMYSIFLVVYALNILGGVGTWVHGYAVDLRPMVLLTTGEIRK